MLITEAAPLTPAEVVILREAMRDVDLSVSNETHKTRRATVNRLARRGLVKLFAGASAGWEPDMWAATPTAAGKASLWLALGGHICGATWSSLGVCTGCGAKRELDYDAFEEYIANTTEEERTFLTSRGRLYCDEHGFARQEHWTTAKTCPLSGSPYHDRGYFRL